MGRIKLIYFLILMSLAINASAQVKKVTPVLLPYEKSFLDLLTRDTTSNVEINLPFITFAFGLNTNEFNGIAILKNKGDLQLQTLGNGKLYKITKERDSYSLARIDATIHSGVNFNSFTFRLRDTLFQYGGNGFWSIRGILTFFSEKTKQWELLQANRLVYGYSSENDLRLFKANKNENRIYLSHSYYYSDFPSTLNTESNDSCYQFDLNKREWTTLGKINPALKAKLNYAIDLNVNNGNYRAFTKDLENFWVNFSNNTFGRFNTEKSNEIKQEWITFYPIQEVKKYFTLTMGDSLYLFKIIGDNQLQKRVISLTVKDFDLTTATFIYSNYVSVLEELKTFLFKYWFYLLILLVLLFIIAYLLIIERKRRTMPEAVNTILYNNFYASLGAVDKELIKVLYQHYLNGEALTTKVINKLIGVQQKDVLTQNKSRSDHFLRINQKFNLSTQKKGALILKKRDELDKRQFTYALNLTFIAEIERLFKD